MSYTPGPWYAFVSPTGIRYVGTAEINIATIHGLEDGKENAKKAIEANANLALIAEAPNLLDGLKMEHGYTDPLHLAARKNRPCWKCDTIERAEGKTT